MHPKNLGVEPKEIRRRVDECLEIVNMTKYAQSSPSKLSGGLKTESGDCVGACNESRNTYT